MPLNGRLLAGLTVLVVAWSGLLPSTLPPFTSHMVMHMAVVALAAPLLALGLAERGLDPVHRWPTRWHAVPLSVVEGLAVWGWHAPSPHHFARTTLLGTVLEQSTFLVTGLMLWSAALGGGPVRRRERATGGVAGLLLTSMHMTLLGALIMLSTRPLYAHHGHGHGLDPLLDQQIGGAVMILAGGAAYLAGALALVAGVLNRRPA